jgi:hypothetical protein
MQTLLLQIEKQLTQHMVPVNKSLWAQRKLKRIKRESLSTIKHLSVNTVSPEENDVEMSKNIKHWKAGLLSLEKMASYALYARLFSLWHVFHLPIFFMMIITAIVHIFVVHMY